MNMPLIVVHLHVLWYLSLLFGQARDDTNDVHDLITRYNTTESNYDVVCVEALQRLDSVGYGVAKEVEVEHFSGQ